MKNLFLLAALFALGVPNFLRADSVKYFCKTRQYRALVEKIGRDLHFQTWKVDAPQNARPEIVIAKGKTGVEGKGKCKFTWYKFEKEGHRYELNDGLGCPPTPPPPNAVGRFDVYIGKTILFKSLCIR